MQDDRRVQRTRRLLQSALVELIKEKGYDPVTIQDITERANLGRTTFYLHYQSKDDLLLDHHADMSTQFNFGIFSREELFGDTPQPRMIEYLELLTQNRPMFHAFRSSKESIIILRRMREQIVSNLENSLKTIFPDAEPRIPLDVLAEYVVGAQLALIDWWMTTRTAYDPAQLATMLHQLQKAVICDAYHVSGA
jgi:AcrR family transcriptional regulator